MNLKVGELSFVVSFVVLDLHGGGLSNPCGMDLAKKKAYVK